MTLAQRPIFPSGPVFPPVDSFDEIRLVRTRPRLYLHRLAQLVGATAETRDEILSHAKYPSPFAVGHEPARRLFAEALRFAWSPEELIDRATERWEPARAESKRAGFLRRQALDAVVELAPFLDYIKEGLRDRGACVHEATRRWSPITLGGVKVADSPAVVLRRNRHGGDWVGLLSFHISKSRPHTGVSARRAAALLEAFTRRDQTATVDPELCIVVDVFACLLVDATYTDARDLADAEQVCHQVADRWSGV